MDRSPAPNDVALFGPGSEPASEAVLPEAELPDDFLEIPERLIVMQNVAGFLPTTRRELHESITLLHYIEEEPGATAAHINHILLHQKKSVSEEPAAAVRNVTHEYAAYAKKARADLTSLLTLNEELQNATGSGQLPLSEVAIHTGIGQLVRQHDIEQVARSSRHVPSDFYPLRGVKAPRRSDKKISLVPASDPYTLKQPEPMVEARIAEVLANTLVWQGRRLVQAAIADQGNRRVFWIERLQESRSHDIARPIARAALENLGVKD